MFRARLLYRPLAVAGRAWLGGCAALCLVGCASAPEAARPVAASGRASPPAAASGGEFVCPEFVCPQTRVLDAKSIEQEAVCLLAHYVQIDTSNPPGNELAAARFLKTLLEREGISAAIVEPVPGRANLMARLPSASGKSRKAIALAHHMDVVPVVASEWSVPPFAGVVRDGALWGRGALDDKAGGVIGLLTMVMAKRLGIALPYDLVLFALADEEAGGGMGARWVVAEHSQWLQNVAYVLNEGGGIMPLSDGRVVYQVEVAQKAPLWLRLLAHGPSGHGAAPSPAMATAHLARALARLADHHFPIEVVPQVQALFAHKAASLPEELRDGARDLRAALERQGFREAFMKDPHRAALVQNTLAITMLQGSDKENVIPGEASAVLDMRLLPGQDASAVTAEVTRVIADPSIEVQTVLSWTAQGTSQDTALYRAIEAQAQTRDPGASVVANVIGGFTDCNAFRSHGVACYGFMPLRLAPDAFAGIHGKDERIAVGVLGEAVIASLQLLRNVPAP